MVLFRHVGEAEASPSHRSARPTVWRDAQYWGLQRKKSGPAVAANCARRSWRVLQLFNQHEPREWRKPTLPNPSTSIFLSRSGHRRYLPEPLAQQKQRVKRHVFSIASRLVSAVRNPNLWSGLQICVFVLEIKALIFDDKHFEYWWAHSRKRFWSYLSTQNCAI